MAAFSRHQASRCEAQFVNQTAKSQCSAGVLDVSELDSLNAAHLRGFLRCNR